jgi:hypothetical protein
MTTTAYTKACEDAGCHDFPDAIIVRVEQQRWKFLAGGNLRVMEKSVATCRRCGVTILTGWEASDAEDAE